MKATQATRSILALAVALTMGAALVTHAPAGQAQPLERRVDRLEDRVSGQAMMRMMNQGERLQREITTLRGEIERLQRQIDDIRDQQRQLYLDLDGRLQALESAPDDPSEGAGPDDDGAAAEPPEDESAAGEAATGAEAEGDASAPADADREAGADTDTGAVREAYDAAFNELRAGRYDAAAQAFRTFLADHPDAELAANARYWLGESHYVVRDFDTALEAFEQVVDNHTGSRKHPDALLKIGYVHLEQGREEKGREALQQVIEQFPDSTAASLAQQRLDEG